MSAPDPREGLQHAVGFHSSAEHLVDQVAALVRAALELDRPVMLSLNPSTAAAVRTVVGEHRDVLAIDHPEGPDGQSGQTLIAARARDLRSGPISRTRSLVITEHCSRFDGPDGHFWTELDAAANIAMADLPVDLTCFFPEQPSNPGVLIGARRNHALLLVDGELHDNPEHRDPVDVLTDNPVPPLPALRPPDLVRIFGTRQLGEIRELVEDAAMRAGASAERAEDVALAVNEVATNAVQHGAGEARFCLWAEPDDCVVEVHDQGVLREPLPGLRPPDAGRRRRRGLWIARQWCSCLHVWTDQDGTHVRIHAGV